jgi:hypothetical protein
MMAGEASPSHPLYDVVHDAAERLAGLVSMAPAEDVSEPDQPRQLV